MIQVLPGICLDFLVAASESSPGKAGKVLISALLALQQGVESVEASLDQTPHFSICHYVTCPELVFLARVIVHLDLVLEFYKFVLLLEILFVVVVVVVAYRGLASVGIVAVATYQ